jgi:hypothetical protein
MPHHSMGTGKSLTCSFIGYSGSIPAFQLSTDNSQLSMTGTRKLNEFVRLVCHILCLSLETSEESKYIEHLFEESYS